MNSDKSLEQLVIEKLQIQRALLKNTIGQINDFKMFIDRWEQFVKVQSFTAEDFKMPNLYATSEYVSALAAETANARFREWAASNNWKVRQMRRQA